MCGVDSDQLWNAVTALVATGSILAHDRALQLFVNDLGVVGKLTLVNRLLVEQVAVVEQRLDVRADVLERFPVLFREGTQMDTWSLAGAVPLFCGMASQKQANKVAEQIKEQFLFPGGLVTTLTRSDEQWDAPNGWAPLQWLAVVGLKSYGHDQLAEQIAGRWLDLNRHLSIRLDECLRNTM